MYSGYQLRNRYPHRRRHLLPILIIILVVITAASITALFVRGFRWRDLTGQFKSRNFDTPALDVWLLEVPDYNDKLDAYKAGLAAAESGLGVYVLPTDNQWSWIAGAYSSEAEARKMLEIECIPNNAKVQFYQIKSKKFKLPSEVFEHCQTVLNAVQKVFQLLLELRVSVNAGADISNLQFDITTQYNQIKGSVEALQTINSSVKSEFVSTVIYSANQNILGLQDIIATKAIRLADVNNALLRTIFSLDNF